jgi:type IV secretion system protein VirB6
VKKYWVFLFALLFLAGCGGDVCIEADDFGHASFTVSARYDKDDFLSAQTGATQVGPWRDSGYQINGEPLTIVVRGWEYGVDYNTSLEVSAWCAWYGQKDNKSTLSKFCERLQDCTFVDDAMCTNTDDARISNVPCLFRNGIGLYALIAEKGSDPNLTLSSQRDPSGINFHVGADTSGYSMYEFNRKGDVRQIGGRVYNYTDEEKEKYNDSKLYFKILDKFYDDNNGQYRIQIKSGVSREMTDPISYMTKLVKEFLFGVNNDYGLIKNIYVGVVNQAGYRAAVSAMLTLYIMFTALSYLAGNIQITHTELLTRIVKIAIVSALLSTEYSWSFFNDFLFAYFIGGVEQIIQIITEAGAGGPGESGILGLMIAPQTIYKVLSLLFVDKLGFIYIVLFIIALCFVIVVYFQAAVIYLTALISMGMIIAMGPVFVCFMLFGITRSLFENWLKQLISYAVQPIILYTGLVFISMILRQEIYGSLGFRVCKHGFPKMSSGDAKFFAESTDGTLAEGLKDSIFYWWFPDPMKGEQFSRTTYPIPVPMDHFTSDDSVVGVSDQDGFCQAYACVENRYIDLPFLDPEKDQRRLNHFWNGNFVQLDGMLLIFAAIYLLYKFNKVAVSTSRFLTGTSGNLTDISNVGGIVGAQVFAGARVALDKTTRFALGQKNYERMQTYRQAVVDRVQYIKNTPSRLIDSARIRLLEKEALSKDANHEVLKEVARMTGLKKADIKVNAVKDYRSALAAKLREIDPALTQSQSEAFAKKMSNKKPSAISDELAKAKFGKKFSELSDKEKQEISKLNDKTLRVQAVDAERAKQFQRAYVQAYKNLSDRGIGIFGKHDSFIRSIEEIKYADRRKKELKDEKNRQFGAELYSKMSGWTGGAIGYKPDDINVGPERENYRKQTYAEILEHQKEETMRKKMDMELRDLSAKYGKNINSPEFLATKVVLDPEDAKRIAELNKEEAKTLVRRYLEAGESPSLMGRTYMEKFAKDSEMERMIDGAYQTRQKILDQDQFISRREEYSIKRDAHQEVIDAVYAELKQSGKDVDSIPREKLVDELKGYYKDSLSKEEAAVEIKRVQDAVVGVGQTERILVEIEKRQAVIDSEINSHIAEINAYRVKAGMLEYRAGELASEAIGSSTKRSGGIERINEISPESISTPSSREESSSRESSTAPEVSSPDKDTSPVTQEPSSVQESLKEEPKIETGSNSSGGASELGKEKSAHPVTQEPSKEESSVVSSKKSVEDAVEAAKDFVERKEKYEKRMFGEGAPSVKKVSRRKIKPKTD